MAIIYGLRCPKCGNDDFEEVEEFKENQIIEIECNECGYVFEMWGNGAIKAMVEFWEGN